MGVIGHELKHVRTLKTSDRAPGRAAQGGGRRHGRLPARAGKSPPHASVGRKSGRSCSLQCTGDRLKVHREAARRCLCTARVQRRRKENRVPDGRPARRPTLSCRPGHRTRENHGMDRAFTVTRCRASGNRRCPSNRCGASPRRPGCAPQAGTAAPRQARTAARISGRADRPRGRNRYRTIAP